MGVKKTKLVMTGEQPKKPGPWETVGKKTHQDAGIPEEERLEQAGRARAGKEAAKTQAKLPKVNPDPSDWRKRQGRT
jgi:hypothetical protein